MKCNQYETKSGKPIRLWQGDCMDLMGQNKQWDLAIVDVQYGIQQDGRNNHTRDNLAKAKDYRDNVRYDEEPPSKEYFNKLKSASINQIIWGANHFISRMPFSSSCWIVWDKDNNDNDFADCELAYTSFDTAVRKIKNTWNGMIQHNMKNKQQRIHPNEKPIRLYRWLLQNYAEKGDSILDTHAGSFSLAIACYIEDFELDIIELDEDYYSDAVERFENHISQKTLF